MKETSNLVLTLKTNESFQIGDNIKVTLLGNRRVAIECPRFIKIVKIENPQLEKKKVYE